jgi:2',3'-cyclic-nucleotide 2'-phosphodiesterase (5'-nucleotidase family)
VETKGLTLEEVDAIFEGHKHSTVPDVELVRTGKEKLDVGAVEQELEKETVEMKSA